MKARKFFVLVAADEVDAATGEFTLDMNSRMATRSFDSFAAAWKFVHSRGFTKEFYAFVDTAREKFERPIVEGYILVGTLECARVEANGHACSEWSRCWSL